MGSGVSGLYSGTAGSTNRVTFNRVQYQGTVKVAGVSRDVSRRVYQRSDIDFEYVDPATGKSNLKLMLAGRAPIGNDGRPVQLHHVLQAESGPIVEVRETTHKEYNRVLHGLGVRNASFRRDPILYRQYNNFRRKYWKWRAQQYQEGMTQ